MPSTIYNVTVDCKDPWQLAQFWAEALGRPVHPESAPGDEEVGVPFEQQGMMIFQRVPEPKIVKNRQHVCLQPDQPRDAEVTRLLGLGATLVEDLRTDDGTGWVVLADPEANEFCVLRSAAERAATS